MLGFNFYEEELELYSDEELEKLVAFINEEISNRRLAEKENLLSELEQVLYKAKEKGYQFYFYEDEPINIQDIEII